MFRRLIGVISVLGLIGPALAQEAEEPTTATETPILTLAQTEEYIEGWVERYNSCTSATGGCTAANAYFYSRLWVELTDGVLTFHHEIAAEGAPDDGDSITKKVNVQDLASIRLLDDGINLVCAENRDCVDQRIVYYDGSVRSSEDENVFIRNCSGEEAIGRKLEKALVYWAKLNDVDVNQEFNLNQF